MAILILMGKFDRDDVDTLRIATALADMLSISDEEALGRMEEACLSADTIDDIREKDFSAALIDEQHIDAPNLAIIGPGRSVIYGGSRGIGKRRIAMLMDSMVRPTCLSIESQFDQELSKLKPKATVDINDLTAQLGALRPKREFPAPDKIPVPKKYSRNRFKK